MILLDGALMTQDNLTVIVLLMLPLFAFCLIKWGKS